VSSLSRKSGFLAILLLLLAGAAGAQLQIGSETQIKGGMSVSAGYQSTYGDQIQSTHGLTYGFSGDFSGYYYNPKFISFYAKPYYNQSRGNSSYQTIFDTSGVNAGADIFSGSHFPGSVSFSDTHNSLGTFGSIPGASNLTTNGDGRGYGISWSELLPGLPTLTVSYSQGHSTGVVLGTPQESSSANRNLNVRSNYTVAGFQLVGSYNRGHLESDTPGFLVGQSKLTSEGDHDSLGLQATHRLPLNGSFYSSAYRQHWNNTYNGVSDGHSTSDSVNAGVNMMVKKLNVFANGTYTDNLAPSVLPFGNTTEIGPTVNLGSNSYGFTISGGAMYPIFKYLFASANTTHVEQFFLGEKRQSTYFSGTLSGAYQKPLFGMLYWSVSAIDNANQEGNTGMGFTTSLNLSRRIKAWEILTGFDYQQNVQTQFIGYTESSYRWRAQVARKVAGRLQWNASATGMQSVFTQQDGDGYNSQTFSTGIGSSRWSVSGNYSQSSGTSVLTSSGIVPVPPGPGIPSNALILFDAKSYGGTGTWTPRRRLLVLGSYTRVQSNTTNPGASSLNDTTWFYTQLQYQFRRLGLYSGFSRFSQGVSVSGLPPAKSNSYFIGVNRWFNVF
jgi:hypothetical protein